MERIKNKKRSTEWVIKNNGDIVYPYVEAEKKGIGRREFRNAIDELIEKGFIDINHQGSGGHSNDMTTYFIDVRWKSYGTDIFRPAKNPRKKDSRKGVGWSAFHANKKKTSITNPLPETSGSSNKSVTPSNKAKKSSSDKIVTPRSKRNQSTDCKHTDNSTQEQLYLWSDKIDTIL